jgi:hypothetical protein
LDSDSSDEDVKGWWCSKEGDKEEKKG